MKEVASEKVAEKSSKDGISERPVVDIVNDEPDIRREFSDGSKAFSTGKLVCRRSRTGTASSVVNACPMVMSVSMFISTMSSQDFPCQLSTIYQIVVHEVDPLSLPSQPDEA